jgi:PAS domain S-box-containing protein
VQLAANRGKQFEVNPTNHEVAVQNTDEYSDGSEPTVKDCEREFSTLVENSSDLISQLDRNFRFLYVSPSVATLFGIPAGEFIGKTAEQLGIKFHESVGFAESCARVFETAERVDEEFMYGDRWYKVRIIPEIDMQGHVECVMCIDTDITDRKNIERDLRSVSARLLEVRDEERKRISRELHDSTAQNLFALDINLAQLIQSEMNPDLKDKLAECKTLCEQSRNEIRTLSYLLHPPMLDKGGLVSAIKWYTAGFSQRCGIRVGFQTTAAPNGAHLPLEIQTDLFRVVQEALANVHHHSGSRVAIVKFDEKPDHVVLQIRDWGSGIQHWDGRKSLPESVGVGISGMRERITQLGGRLEIQSGRFGTTITAVVPLPHEQSVHRVRA